MSGKKGTLFSKINIRDLKYTKKVVTKTFGMVSCRNELLELDFLFKKQKSSRNCGMQQAAEDCIWREKKQRILR